MNETGKPALNGSGGIMQVQADAFVVYRLGHTGEEPGAAARTSGQGLTEYALGIALCAVVVLVVVWLLGWRVTDLYDLIMRSIPR